MDFNPTDEQKDIRDTVRKFAETKIKPLAHEPAGDNLLEQVKRDVIGAADLASGEIRSLITEPACCPAWMRK
mgnify:CR=1 FL=1